MTTKQWLYDNLRRDASLNWREDISAQCWQEAVAIACFNVRSFGAQRLECAIGPTTWPENYGDCPFAFTYAVARRIVRGAPDMRLAEPDSWYKAVEIAARKVVEGLTGPQMAPSTVDVGTISEYGMTQRLSVNIRCF